jgi:NAD(P)-dependent dehydrogenase (short-subunit alcohol dehydrogenase family)
MGKLDNKIAVVTGGSSGIGLAAAELFVAEGAHVFIMGRRAAQLEKAAAQISRNVTTVTGDVANVDDIDRLYEVVAQEQGRVDIVMANAAFVELVPFPEATPEHFDQTFGVNVRGVFFTAQKALPLFRDGGSIVLTSSVAHKMGWSAWSAYSASKAAVRSFARSWAVELKERNIRVNALSPGAVETPFIDGLFTSRREADDARDALSATLPLGRLADPREIASAALFLACDESSYCTGTDLLVDGGRVQI